jgi:hypothetical protein
MIWDDHTYFGTFKIFKELTALRDMPLGTRKDRPRLLRPYGAEKGREHACAGLRRGRPGAPPSIQTSAIRLLCSMRISGAKR